MKLRDYQSAAITSLYDYWRNDKGSHPLIVAPTASGKSLLIAKLLQDVCIDDSEAFVICLAHVKELLEQNYKELKSIWPQADAGIYSAGLNKKQLNNQIVFAGIQSIYNKAHLIQPPTIVLVDESHLIPKSSDTMYGRFLADVKVLSPKVKFVGYTATPYRLDSGYLHKGKDALFDGIAYEIQVKKLIDEGYLCPIISKGGVKKIDLSGVHKRGGEYIEQELAEAASEPKLVKSACNEIVEYGKERKAWLIFACGIAHAEIVKTEIEGYGIACAVVSGKTKKKERKKVLDDFKSGNLRCVVNIGVLTTGFNAPICDMVVMLRATMSTALYVQCVGRAMRLYPGKENGLLLDYGNNVIEHGPIDNVVPKVKSSGGEGDEAPAKECPGCRALIHAAIRECPECGHQFPPPTPNHGHRAFDGAIMSQDIRPKYYEVTRVSFSLHKKKGAPDKIKATFWCGLVTFSEWWCIEHSGYAGHIAKKNIAIYLGKGEATIDTFDRAKSIANAKECMELLSKPLLPPRGIWVKTQMNYPEITDKIWI